MSADNSNLIYNNLADAIHHAILQYGDDIIDDTRLMGVLKEYGALKEIPSGDQMIQVLLEKDTLRRLIPVSKKEKSDINDSINREITILHNQYSFSDIILKKILCSILYGMNSSLAFDQQSEAISINHDHEDLVKKDARIERPIPNNQKNLANDISSDQTMQDIIHEDLPALEEDNRKDTKAENSKSTTSKRGLIIAITAILTIIIGFSVAVNSKGDSEINAEKASENAASDRIYFEILEDIHKNDGKLSSSGKEKLNKALRENPDDYWFNVIKERTK